jgi:AhpD family alkylhydroperoxidase
VRDFRRRTYAGPGALARDLRALLRQRGAVREVLAGRDVGPAFRERLMLVVTSVNACRYCARLHTRLARRAGLTGAEARELLGGSLAPAPAEELAALRYAAHWAEAGGAPDAAARRELVAEYGLHQADRIEAALRLIQVGNLVGNTFDSLLFRLSGGRLGVGHEEWRREGPSAT